MKSPYLLSTLLLQALLLAGCSGSLIESKKVEYKSASTQQLPRLEVPPDLTAPNRDERYAVPDVAAKGPTTFSSYSGEKSTQQGSVPATAGALLPQGNKMRIERSGTQRWLVVSGIPPEKLWPSLKEFWQGIGFVVNLERPEAGIMETDWAENRVKLSNDVIHNVLGKFLGSAYSTPERDKFRTRLEKGAEPGSTEIYISHRGLYETYIDEGRSETRWQPRPADPELEAEMLSRVMVRLGADEGQAKALVKSTEAQPERAKLDQASAGTLQLAEPFDRAWRRVGLVLDRVGFTVEDRDRAQGLYFVRYVDLETDNTKKADPGFLSKLMFWKGGKADASQNAQFRIQVKGAGDTTTVKVLSREGGNDQSDTSKKILGLLLEQLK